MMNMQLFAGLEADLLSKILWGGEMINFVKLNILTIKQP